MISGIAVQNSPAAPLVPYTAADNGTVTCTAAGNCTVLDLPGGKLLQNSSSVAEQGGDSIIAWGRWANGRYNNTSPGYRNTDLSDQQGLHYVYGLPTPTLPSTGSFGYSVLGATMATSLDGTLGLGTFSGTLAGGNVLAVNFASGKMDLGFQVAFAGPTYTVQGSNLSVTPQFSFSGAQLTCGNCTGASVNGFFAGPAAERAGLGYQINTGSNTVSGVAALTR